MSEIKEIVNVKSKKWWIDYSQGLVIAAIIVIFISIMTSNTRDLGIGIWSVCYIFNNRPRSLYSKIWVF